MASWRLAQPWTARTHGAEVSPRQRARLLFAAAGLPAPTTQRRISTGRGIIWLDFAWEGAKVAIEIDGFLYHSASGDFQRDRTKQNAAQRDGWLIWRFTVRDRRERPDEVIAILRSALSPSAEASARADLPQFQDHGHDAPGKTGYIRRHSEKLGQMCTGISWEGGVARLTGSLGHTGSCPITVDAAACWPP